MLTIQERVRQIAKEIDALNQNIGELHHYIDINRHDRESVRDAQEDITRYESRILSLTGERQQLLDVLNKRTVAATHTPTYNPEQELKDLRRSYDKLEARADTLQELMFNCNVNMDNRYRAPDLTHQAERDLTAYQEEYRGVSAQMDKIYTSIKTLEERIKKQNAR